MGFPKSFLWGVSASGFQFEMGDGAGKNVDPNTDWYVWVHDITNVRSGLVSGDLPENGIDYWSLYKKDHDIAKNLGLNAYRIGTEWSRIFPKSTKGIKVGVERASDGNISKIEVDSKAIEELDRMANNEALSHYRDVINDLKTKSFKIFVCLNHFTLPLWTHNPITVRDTKLSKGPRGWLDETTIIEFTKYAAYMAWKIGEIVDNWITFNEPMVIPEAGYLSPESGFPPGLNNFKASRKVARNMVIAHARAYDAIKRLDTTKADEDGVNAANVGLIQDIIPTKPLNEKNELDIKAASFIDNMHNHFFPQSISHGRLDENFSGVNQRIEVKAYLKDRLDWLGVNYYTRPVVKGRRSILARLFAGMPVIPEMVKSYGFLCTPNSKAADGMPTSDFGWEVFPEGILQALKAMERYERPLYITENGLADTRDDLRPKFLIDHLQALDKALIEEKIDVRGYFHWSLTDNYEWAKGFTMKFGLCAIDLGNKKRVKRKSADIYKKIIENQDVTEANL
ncbi:MAG TPA: beta-galactosidase BgaS [Acidobacteriota bacterium]|nr:beta-galactosidase BgaS [Acidobacteriota bacterium]